MRASNPIKETRHIGLMGEELGAFLNSLKASNPKQFRAIEKSLQLLIPNVRGIDIEITELGEVEFRIKERGITMPARVLSEGTLRMLGLLSLTGMTRAPAVVGFEEPENGMHPRRIQLIAELLKVQAALGQSQYIVTTHSPALLDLMPNDSILVVRKEEGHTSIAPFSTWGPLGRMRDIQSALTERPVSERLPDFDGLGLCEKIRALILLNFLGD